MTSRRALARRCRDDSPRSLLGVVRSIFAGMPKVIYAVEMPVGIAMMLYPTPMISDVSNCPSAVFGAVSPKPAVVIVTTARYIAWECEGQREKPFHPIESRAQSEVHFGYRTHNHGDDMGQDRNSQNS